jgi:transcriptional regulator of acetoin/glycerol metabolism
LFDIAPERLFAAKASRGLVALRLNDTGSTLYARVRPPPVARMPAKRTATLQPANVPAAPSSGTPAMADRDVVERKRIVAAMSEAKWRTEQAAQALGMSRATLYRRIAKLHIMPPHKC